MIYGIMELNSDMEKGRIRPIFDSDGTFKYEVNIDNEYHYFDSSQDIIEFMNREMFLEKETEER